MGAVSLASSSQARRRALEGIDEKRKATWIQRVLDYGGQIDAFGLLQLGFAFALLLSPFTLSATAIGGYKNRKSLRVDSANTNTSLSHRHACHRRYPLHHIRHLGSEICHTPRHATSRPQQDVCHVLYH
jgi:hypothetical protein